MDTTTKTLDVDLKWSLWSACEGTWEEYAPEVLKVLKGLKVGQCQKKYEAADNDVIDSLRECIPHTMFMCEPGCEREFEVKARSLGKLLAAIDEEEAKLLDEDKREWEMIEGLYSKRKKGK